MTIPPPMATTSSSGRHMHSFSPKRFAQGRQAPCRLRRPPTRRAAVSFTIYHPVLIEYHYSLLLCPLMLGDFAAFLSPFVPVATVVDSLEGYPVPRSRKAQVGLVQTPERLAGGWRVGVRPHSHVGARRKARPKVHPVGFPTPFVPSSPTSVEATLYPESGGGTLFNPLSFTPTPSLAPATPSHLAAPLSFPTPALHDNFDLAETLDRTRIILAPRHRAAARAHAEHNALEKREAVVLATFVLVFIFRLWRRRGEQIQRQGEASANQYPSA